MNIGHTCTHRQRGRELIREVQSCPSSPFRLISRTHAHAHSRTELKQPNLGMKGFCDPMGQTRILWGHSTRVCLGPKTIITHMHLTIVALNYHFATVCSTCTACPGLPCTAVMKALTPKPPVCQPTRISLASHPVHRDLLLASASVHYQQAIRSILRPSSSILPFNQPFHTNTQCIKDKKRWSRGRERWHERGKSESPFSY